MKLSSRGGAGRLLHSCNFYLFLAKGNEMLLSVYKAAKTSRLVKLWTKTAFRSRDIHIDIHTCMHVIVIVSLYLLQVRRDRLSNLNISVRIFHILINLVKV